MKPQFVGIVGLKKSGKTTLIEKLTVEMTARSLIVGTIKLTTHDLIFDIPGKDTERHRRAGSKITLIKSKSESAIFVESGFLENELKSAIFGKCDFVFIEGDSSSDNPKIYVADKNAARQDVSGEIIAVWGERKEIFRAAHFETDEICKLCDFLLQKYEIGRK